MLGQNLQNVGDQIMDFYLAKTYKKGLPKTFILHNCLYYKQIVTFLFVNQATFSYAQIKRPGAASSDYHNHLSPHWGVSFTM